MLSLCWIAFSFFLMYGSYWHGKNYGNIHQIYCDKSGCKISSPKGLLVSFPRESIINTEVVRIDGEGNVVSPVGISKSLSRKLGYSIQIEYSDSGVAGSKSITTKRKTVTSVIDMGRNNAKSTEAQLRDYKSNHVNYAMGTAGSSITLVGILLFFAGIFSLFASFVFGIYKDENPRDLRKNK